MKRSAKSQVTKPSAIDQEYEDLYLNLNPDISKTIKEYQDTMKAQKQAKESLEKHRRILEED
ncbi:hypothetical protein [Anabaena azotica]|uniref:Uncharacterized protein n=1 Tax=Anabaena azotica FACHB-119 TaxID=947527 RepID=A0ABR8DDW9_9NOST|nr:hypothetical protein [Anabaena azotica]MBD2505188.1 hypothetical protein [Anabaena azotica FACHB-119]